MGGPRAGAQTGEGLSRQNIVTTLRVKIKTLEEKNRELTGILELCMGACHGAREECPRGLRI
jgi:hypothetical protein